MEIDYIVRGTQRDERRIVLVDLAVAPTTVVERKIGEGDKSFREFPRFSA
jgi:hypothetical protein